MSSLTMSLLLLIGCSLSASGQIVGETADQLNFGQIFSRVDSDLNGNLFKDFVDFTGGDLLEYDDLIPSESALTEQQLTDRQTKLRELYRGRRPIGGGKVSPRVSFFNRLKGGKKKKTEEKRDPIKEKILDKFQSGLAVTVVKPPPGYSPPQDNKQNGSEKEKEKKKVKEKEKEKEKTHKNPLKDWRGKQKQREAVATSLIGSRLKDLKEKRKQFMNSNLVTEQTVEDDNVQPAERTDQDFQSLEEMNAKSGGQLVKVQIEEKSSESHFKFPTKKRRFKPQIKSATASPKWTIKEKFKNKHKHKLEIQTKTKVETTDKTNDVENKNQQLKNIGKDPITEPPMEAAVEVKVQTTPAIPEAAAVSEEILGQYQINFSSVHNLFKYFQIGNLLESIILDEVYGKLGGMYDKVSKLKATDKEKEMEKKEETQQEKEPSWMSTPRKKSSPLKHIDAEESALPLSIIPHGVPMTRGFPETSSQSGLLVLPSPAPIRPAISQFLSFGPLKPTTQATTTSSNAASQSGTTTTTSTTSPDTLSQSEAFNEKLATLKKMKKPAVQPVTGFSEEETAELIEEEEDDEDEKQKMAADLMNTINTNIEEVLDIKMPNNTKLLSGDNDGQRFERNSNFSSDEVRNVKSVLVRLRSA